MPPRKTYIRAAPAVLWQGKAVTSGGHLLESCVLDGSGVSAQRGAHKVAVGKTLTIATSQALTVGRPLAVQTRPGRTGYGPSLLMTERAGDQGIPSILSPREHCGITRKRERPVACGPACLIPARD